MIVLLILSMQHDIDSVVIKKSCVNYLILGKFLYVTLFLCFFLNGGLYQMMFLFCFF